MSQDNNIKVIARFRPPNSLEQKSGGIPIVKIEDESTVGIKCEEHTGAFTFDRVFGSDTTQSQIYNYAIKDTLEDIFNGYNGTVFCYGQTGSGKTFTMMGADIDNDDLKGIIPRIVEGIFTKIVESPPTLEYMVKASYMEIYMERIRDLLSPDDTNLPIHEDKTNGVYVKDLMEVFVSSIDEVYQVMRQGSKNRVVAYTNMNAESSRSHSIFQISIEQKDTVSGKTKMGRLFLVDLAGSEKVGKTGATGQTLEEAKKINKSLSALGMVINALTDGKSTHIPYRDSKLTRILQESLGGNSRTTLIINCSPSSFNASETVSTLRFGMRAKSIKNKAKVNQEFSPAELKQMLKKARTQVVSFQAYISALEGEVRVWRSGGTVESENYAAWDKVTSKDKASIAHNTASGAVARSSTPRSPGTATPRSINTGRYSISAGVGNSAPPLSPTPTGTRVGSPTPTLGLNDSLLSELGSRSGSPTTVMSEDEREEFLRRENELNDLLAEKDRELQETTKQCESMREELDFIRIETTEISNKNEELSTETSQLRLELEKVSFGHKEAEITIESLTDEKDEMTNQLDKLKEEIDELKKRARSSPGEDKSLIEKEKVRDARIAAMLNGMDSAKAMSRHEAGMGELLRSLVEAGDDDSKKVELLSRLRKELDETRDMIQDRDNTINELYIKNRQLTSQCDESDSRYDKLLAEYEEMVEQAIAFEEQHDSQDTETINDLKQKLEAHYTNKLNSQRTQLESVQRELQHRVDEVAKNVATIRDLRGENREYQAKIESMTEEIAKLESSVAKPNASSGALSTDATAATEHAMVKEREMHQMRRDMAQRILEYDTMRKSLMRDVQNRCEKIIELEMALDDAREQISNLNKRVNNPSQPQRMALLEKNIAQLTLMQKELVIQNTELKKQVSLNDRKLQARSERIAYLEDRLNSASSQIEALKRKNESLQTQKNHESVRASKPPTSGGGLRFGRIAKPMRGGGGQPAVVEEKTTGRNTGFFNWGSN